jgi:hypothetical protein
MKCLLLFHRNNGDVKALQCDVTRTLTVLWKVIFSYVVSNERYWCDYKE